MSDCIFCKIIAGEIPSNKVYEDDEVIAFHDIAPQAPVHVLVVPKAHVQDILHVDPDSGVMAAVVRGIHQVAKALNLDPDGIRVVNNCGKKAGQTVYHLHFHVLSGQQMSEHMCG